MKNWLVGLLFLFATVPSIAATDIDGAVWTFKDGTGSVTLLATPCSSKKVLNVIEASEIPYQYQNSKILFQGKDINGCWALVQREGQPPFVCLIGEDEVHLDVSYFNFKKPI